MVNLITFTPGFGRRHKQTSYGYHFLRNLPRVLRTGTISFKLSRSEGHSLIYMSVTCDTQTHTQSQQRLCVSTSNLYRYFCLSWHIGKGLLLHFVGEETEIQRQEVDSLETLHKLGAYKTPNSRWALCLPLLPPQRYLIFSSGMIFSSHIFSHPGFPYHERRQNSCPYNAGSGCWLQGLG